MKKILVGIVIGSLVASYLSANVIKTEKIKLSKSPIDKKFLSVENGGTKSAIDAYSDGIGLSIVGTENIDNSSMNENVYVYGSEAKANEESLKDYLQKVGNSNDLEIIVPTASAGTVGDPCDDGKTNTTNDMYIDTNGTCKGILEKTENKCFGDEIGSQFYFNGKLHLVVDDTTIRDNLNRAETLCVSNVINMHGMFYGETSFNQNISNWDVSNVKDMGHMFYAAISFNQDISNWNTKNVKNFNHMFVYAKQFYQDLSNWDTSSVIDKTIFTTTFANRTDLINSTSPIFYNKNYLPK
jgi:surface protein